MTVVTKLLLVSALALSFAAPALAQEESTLNERDVYVFMNGKMVHMQAGDDHHSMIMKNFKRMKEGTMVYFSGGRLYIGQDKKMKGGKMMSTMIFGKDLGISSQR